MQNLQYSQSYQYIYNKKTENINASYLKYLGSRFSQTKQEGQCEEQNGKSARIDAVYQGGDDYHRQKPASFIAKIPQRLSSDILVLEKNAKPNTAPAKIINAQNFLVI